MDLNNLALFSMANKEMGYLTERQKVLATNIANANTPGYRPKDLEQPSFASYLKSTVKSPVMMARTNEKHLAGIPSTNGGYRVYQPKTDHALTIDGNGVVLEDQLNEASKTKSDYNRVLTIYGKYKTMLQTANTKINS